MNNRWWSFHWRLDTGYHSRTTPYMADAMTIAPHHVHNSRVKLITITITVLFSEGRKECNEILYYIYI